MKWDTLSLISSLWGTLVLGPGFARALGLSRANFGPNVLPAHDRQVIGMTTIKYSNTIVVNILHRANLVYVLRYNSALIIPSRYLGSLHK